MTKRFLIYIICVLGFAAPIRAEEELNVSKIIFEHLGDSYEWHIAKGATIPLPCILIGEQGVDVFMSDKLEHGAIYKGYHIAEAGDHEGKIVNEAGERPFDISITKNVLELFIVCILLCSVVLGLARWYKKNGAKKAPGGFVGMVLALSDDGVPLHPDKQPVRTHSRLPWRCEPDRQHCCDIDLCSHGLHRHQFLCTQGLLQEHLLA